MNKSKLLSLLMLAVLLLGPALSCSLPLPGRPAAEPSPTSGPLAPTQPLLLERSPARGEEAPLERPLTLVFDQPMDRASTEAAFSITPQVAGRFSWPDPTTLTFIPEDGWQRATRYHVKVENDAQSTAGLSLRESLDFTFATVGYLEVTQVIPAPDAAEVAPDSTVTVMFNRPVVPLQLVSAPTSDLPSPLTFDPPVEGSGEWINTSIYSFRPATYFIPGQTYRATVAAGLSDTTGGVLEEDYSWSFAIQSPYVVWTNPQNLGSDIPLDVPIVVQFSQPMDRASAEAAFSLDPAAPGRFSWNDDNTVMTFTLQGLLAIETRFTGRIARTARSAVGSATLGDDFTWTFDTVRRPCITRTDPADGDTAADSSTSFTIYFCSPMDVATLERNITILPEPTLVYTWWSSYDNSFYISWDTQPSTDYEVMLDGDMADLYGNTIGSDSSVRFTTRALDPLVYPAVPNDVGSYSAYTNTYVYLVHRNVSQVDLTLHRLDWPAFARLNGPDRWDLWDSYRPPTSALVRQWTIPTESPLNEQRYLRVDLAEDGGALPPGYYLLEASAPEMQQLAWWRPTRHILVVTRVHLTLKLAPRELLVWATDLSTGQPIPGLDVTVYHTGDTSSSTPPAVASGNTDQDGVFRAEIEPSEDVWSPYLAVAGAPGEASFGTTSSDWSSGIGPWDFDLNSDFAPRPYRVYLYTDRPIYRPGQPVYFRGIVRAEDDVHYSLPDITRIPITVMDDQGQQVYSETLPISDMGTFAGQFTLGEEATLGYYYLSAEASATQSDSVGFQVAEYRRPEFQVSVTTDRDEVLAGDAIAVSVQASYYFGGPVSDAAVSWTLLTQDVGFRPDVPGWWDWSDTSHWDWWQPQEVPGWGRVIADGSGRTDAQGRFTFSVPADIADAVLSQQFTIEATVTDISDRSVSNRTTVLVHKGLFYIGLRPARYVGQVGEEQTVEIRTVDWDSQPVGNVPLVVTFSRREWLNVQEEDRWGNLYWTWTPSDTLVYSQTVTGDADGQALARFVPADGGTYIVRATGSDGRGNEVASATWMWVSSREYVSWRQENNDRIQPIADRREYRPGDTARILIPSPFQGPVTALFTVERGRILQHWVQTLAGNAETIDLPITADMAPNVYLSVVLVTGVDATNPAPTYRVGYVSFDVSTEQRELTITLTPDRDLAAGETYGPRETVSAEVQVTDANGRPVEAEVSVAVVDKAVLALAAPNAPAILDAFYGQRGLGIRTADSLSISVDRVNVVVARQAKGGGGGGEAMGAQTIRRDFPDTAYWSPDVRTDTQGRATVEFRLPDQLTTWHLDARAVTADTLVGQSELELVSTKPLLLQPITPRFFVVGDHADVAATVHNNTDGPLTVDVWLDAGGVTLLDVSHQTITIPAGGRQRVDWMVEVSDAEAADLTFHATGGGYSDATKPPAGLPPDQLLPIYRYSAPETVGTAGQLDEAGDILEAVSIPRTLDTSQGELTVRVEPSLAAAMTGGLDYLEHYPYECTEQVVSRFLPNVLTYQALVELGLSDPELAANLREQVTIGLQRLYARQHYDGGWGWWVNDPSDPLISAYVVFGMLRARDAGFAVDSGVLERGLAYLRGQVLPIARVTERGTANRQSFILYVLAEAGEAQQSDLVALYNVRARLGHYGRAYLALAFDRVHEGDSRIQTLLSDLNNAAIVSATGAHWQESEADRWNWNTDTRTTAVVLDALARLDPDNRLAANTVRWLMTARSADHWETTQETAWALIALTDWMVATGELEGNYNWQVQLNGETLGSGGVTPATVRETETFRVDIAELLLDQPNRLLIGRGEGPGRLYYTAHLRAYLPVEDVQALNRGIIIGRVYERADCAEDCEPITQAQVGERVRVRLTIIVPNDLYYAVIEDPFPAGAEAIDSSLLTTSIVEEQPELSRPDAVEPWWWWGWQYFTNTDLRDERLVLFATTLPRGSYEYTYMLQMGLPGEYRVLPAHGYEMYFPEVMGRSDGMIFTVEP